MSNKRRPKNRQVAKQQQNAQQGTLSAQFRMETQAFTSALPPPAVLGEYSIHVQDGAERLMTMAEEQAAHRRHLESSVILGDSRRAYLGLIFAFLQFIVIVAAATYLAMNDREVIAGALVGMDLTGLAGVYLLGVRSRREERLQKAGAVGLRHR